MPAGGARLHKRGCAPDPAKHGAPHMRKGATSVLVLCIAMVAAVSADPAYLAPVAPGWRSGLITVGESVNDKPDASPYCMGGIPDRLGAYDNHDGTFIVLMNHELREVAGVRRAHGGIGAFISQWTSRKICSSPTYLLACSCYVELSPVRAARFVPVVCRGDQDSPGPAAASPWRFRLYRMIPACLLLVLSRW